MIELAAELKDEPTWKAYAEYCDLRGRYNEAAREAARRFLEDTQSWDFETETVQQMAYGPHRKGDGTLRSDQDTPLVVEKPDRVT